MDQTVLRYGPFAATAVYVVAGAGLGLVVGYFGRMIVGLAAAALLVAVLMGMAEPYLNFLAKGLTSIPHAEMVGFLTTAGGIGALGGFVVGLLFAARKAR